MTITDDDVRTALQRAVDRADLALDPFPPLAGGEPLAVPRPRWPRVLAIAAVLLAVVALAAVARSGTQQVRTDPADGAAPSAPAASSTTPATVPPVRPDPTDVTVRVLNGSGTSAVAADLASQLAALGYEVLPAANALAVADTAHVYFAPGQEVAAQDVATRIRAGQPEALPQAPLDPDGLTSADVVVVLGEDWTSGPLAEVPSD